MLSSAGSSMLHGDGTHLWFNAEDGNGDDEPYRLNSEGQLLNWNLSPSGDTLVTNWVSHEQDLFAVALRGSVRQVVHLMDNGTSQWLTNLAPSSGDSHIGEGLEYTCSTTRWFLTPYFQEPMQCCGQPT